MRRKKKKRLMETPGDRIRAARLQLKLKQRELAGRIGVQPLQISRWERNDVKEPRSAAFSKFAALSGKSVEYFLTGEDAPQLPPIAERRTTPRNAAEDFEQLSDEALDAMIRALEGVRRRRHTR